MSEAPAPPAPGPAGAPGAAGRPPLRMVVVLARSAGLGPSRHRSQFLTLLAIFPGALRPPRAGSLESTTEPPMCLCRRCLDASAQAWSRQQFVGSSRSTDNEWARPDPTHPTQDSAQANGSGTAPKCRLTEGWEQTGRERERCWQGKR